MKKLIFVYNGDSGLVNSVIHLLHKKFSPDTYECQLCAIIYDGAKQDKQWVDFIKGLSVTTEYLHRDTYIKKYGEINQALPVVLVQDNEQVVTGISAEDFIQINTMTQLQDKISTLTQV